MALRLTAQRLISAPYSLHAVRAAQPISRLDQISRQIQYRNMSVPTYTSNGDNGDQGSTEGELNAWKHRAPYRVHDKNEHFKTRYEGSCHCGKIKYQLSREKPLDAKYCHCTTCQKIHGKYKSVVMFVEDAHSLLYKVHHSNGQPSSTRTTSTSPTVTMTLAGTKVPRRHASTSCRVKSAARTAEHLSWTRVGI